MDELQRVTKAFIATLLCLAVGGVALLIVRAPPPILATLLTALAVVGCMAAAWLFPIQFGPRTKFYVDTAVTVAAVLLLPPGIATAALGLGTLAAHAMRDETRDLPQALFNAAHVMLVALAAGLALRLAGWHPLQPSFTHPRLLLVLPLVTLMMYLLNVVLVSTIGALEMERPVGRSVRAALREDFRVEVLTYAALVTTGLLAAMVAGAYRWGVVLLIVPLVATYLTLQHQARSRQLAERARLMSDASLAEAQRLAKVGSWEWQPATDQWAWSDEVYRLLGLEPGATPSSRHALLISLASGDRERLECALRAAQVSGQPFEIEHCLRLPDGSERVLHQRAEPLARARESEGETALTFLGTMQDVTERVRAEETMRRAKEAAQEANRAKTQLLSMASHDLRTPLTAIQGYLEIVLDGSSGDLNAEQREFLETAHRNTLQLAALVNDLLDLARIEAGRLHLRRRPVDVNRAVAQVIHALVPQAAAKGLRLWRAPHDGPHFADVDPARFDQMLQNLVGNAIKFTEEGGVTATVCRNGAMVEIAVSDTGIGIPPELMPHIFEEFNQGGETARRRGGAGLGLAIVKQLATLHGGQVSVQSEPGQGSTFTLRLPAAASQSSTREGEGRRPAGDPHAVTSL